MSRLKFELEGTASGSRARAARFQTAHNEVLTPTFMPVGTHAAVRAQRREDVLQSGAQVVLANTYHLMLRPGVAMFAKFGGIHRFMNWPRSVLTDSGGFQIFSLPGSRSVREEGAEFRSYVDRTVTRLTPETSIAAQRAIGSDVMMVLDQCVPATVDHATAQAAMELTHRWAQRSLNAREDSPQALFGIVQGASYPDLRERSARAIGEMPFDGYAIGGLAVGEGAGQREDCTAVVTELLPPLKPRYLMGVGTPRDLLEAVHRGVDMFDCILPTALAKQGVAFTSMGRRDLRRAAYRDNEGPIDPTCACHTCATYSIAYLYHLNRVREPQGWQLLGAHNIHFYMHLMAAMRARILDGTWLDYYRSQRAVLDARDSYGPTPTHVTKAERREARRKLGRFEAVVTGGVGRVRDTRSGEVMHSVNDPIEEAHALYIDQSRLLSRLRAGGADTAETRSEPLVVWDVGLGAAANAMAAIQAVEKTGDAETSSGGRRVLLVSFENDLDSLILALRHPAWFKHLRHAAPRGLLANGVWSSPSGGVEWRLLRGDFRETQATAPSPDLIFYDPFSANVDNDMWSMATFREVAEACVNREVELFTYSASTRVRTALLAVGFFLARGRGTGPKAETTIGLSPLAASGSHGRELLGREFLARWRRSAARSPWGVESGDESWIAAVLEHPQFRQWALSD